MTKVKFSILLSQTNKLYIHIFIFGSYEVKKNFLYFILKCFTKNPHHSPLTKFGYDYLDQAEDNPIDFFFL